MTSCSLLGFGFPQQNFIQVFLSQLDVSWMWVVVLPAAQTGHESMSACGSADGR